MFLAISFIAFSNINWIFLNIDFWEIGGKAPTSFPFPMNQQYTNAIDSLIYNCDSVNKTQEWVTEAVTLCPDKWKSKDQLGWLG